MNEDARKIRLIMELRQSGIKDTRVLSAIERVPRDVFVSPAFIDQAYENTALPIDQGQTISQPYVVAFMAEALELGERSKVLEVGTGSGYQASRSLQAVPPPSSPLNATVPCCARRRATSRRSASIMVVTRYGDGTKGWPEQAPFDRIIVAAAGTEVPQALKDQLAPGGVMVIPVGRTSWEQQVVRLRRAGDEFTAEEMLPVRFVPLLEGVVRERAG